MIFHYIVQDVMFGIFVAVRSYEERLIRALRRLGLDRGWEV